VIANVLALVYVVALRRARLVLGWVTVCVYTNLVFNKPPRPTQPGHPSVVGVMSADDDIGHL